MQAFFCLSSVMSFEIFFQTARVSPVLVRKYNEAAWLYFFYDRNLRKTVM